MKNAKDKDLGPSITFEVQADRYNLPKRSRYPLGDSDLVRTLDFTCRHTVELILLRGSIFQYGALPGDSEMNHRLMTLLECTDISLSDKDKIRVYLSYYNLSYLLDNLGNDVKYIKAFFSLAIEKLKFPARDIELLRENMDSHLAIVVDQAEVKVIPVSKLGQSLLSEILSIPTSVELSNT